MDDTPFDALFAELGESRDEARTDQLTELLSALAVEHDGCALLDDLRSSWPDAILMAGLTAPEDDRRRRPPMRAGLVGGHRMVWLTSGGWTAAGFSNRREHRPAAAQLRHRFAGRSLGRWVRQTVAPHAVQRGVLVSVVEGAELRAYISEQVSSAWSAVKLGGARGDAAGVLLGGLYPDLLLSESWPAEQAGLRRQVYPQLVGRSSDAGPGWDHEVLIAVEVETSAKASGVLSAKVAAHSAAHELGWFAATVWVTDDAEVATRLRRSLQVPGGGLRPGHLTAHPADCGVTELGTDRVVPTTWGWPALLG